MMARINFQTSGVPSFTIAVNADFATSPPTNIGASSPIADSLWDVALWDGGVWSGGLTNYNAWQSVAASGFCLAIVVAFSVQAEATWTSTDLVFEEGGIL